MKILIRGAGDLATGIAHRLFRAGYQILMTEKAVPTSVRRAVAFSRAVYEGWCEVEEVTARFAEDYTFACHIIDAGEIAVIVDEQAEIKSIYEPQVIVDAILAKRNLGTKITDAKLVIGVGPGFTAQEDCHVVIETKRGHDIGRVIMSGSAVPNTGIPGDIGGYTMERLIRADVDGVLYPLVQIGDIVKKDQRVADVIIAEDSRFETKGAAVSSIHSRMTGIVRGMLQEGVFVTKGMKVGDIDVRCERGNCFTISDKARSVGGGVLEAVTGFEHKTDGNLKQKNTFKQKQEAV